MVYQPGFSRETEPSDPIAKMYYTLYIFIYYKELDYTIMEADRSQDLQSELVGKLKTQQSWWFSSSLNQALKNQESS